MEATTVDGWEHVGQLAEPQASSPAPDDIAQVAMDTASTNVVAFLEGHGLTQVQAHKLAQVTEAQTAEDFKLLDAHSVEEAIRLAELGLIPAKKFRLAMQSLSRDEGDLGVTCQEPKPAIDAAMCERTANPSEPQKLEECVVICIDRSGSMGAPFSTDRTRMEAVKQMFYAFRDRTDSLGGHGSHRIGLLQFDDRVEQLLTPTANLDLFEAVVDDMEKRGMTAIYSAIASAAEMLEPILQEIPTADLRILALTDGTSNTGCSAEEALASALRVGAVVDAIIVGDRPDAQLRKIVNATGGECFQIADLGEGFELLEAERVVSLKARRGGIAERSLKPSAEAAKDSAQLLRRALAQEMTRGREVARAAPINQEVEAKKAKLVADVSAVVVTASSSQASSPAIRRVLAEIGKLANGMNIEGVHVFPSPEDVMFWRVLVEGPLASPFEGGVFALQVVVPSNFPFKPPAITFDTPIYHCNVNDSGKICLDELQGGWSPSKTIAQCLQAIRNMLAEPDTDNALRQWIAEETLGHLQHGDADTRYPDKARQSVLQNASQTVNEFKCFWGC